MSEPHDQLKAADDGVDPPIRSLADDAPQDDNPQSSQFLLCQIVDQLVHLQREYRQVRSWLQRIHLRLSRQEDEVSRRLDSAMTVIDHQGRPLAGDPTSPTKERPAAGLSLRVQTLGKFQVYCGGQAVPLGSSKKGRAIFRYLITHSERRAFKDVLLELFWPGEPLDKASHKLHIAISALRQAVHDALSSHVEGGECVLFEDEYYFVNPEIHVHLDFEQFTSRFQAGERLEREDHVAEAFLEYESARALYRGDFLTEDLYADWSIAPRARLEETYLTLLGRLAAYYLDRGQFAESTSCCRQILSRDSFREDAYRQLMCCYSRMGQRNQALREFHACEQVLQQELGVRPMRETVDLYERIAREEPV